jgi:hypothetical protein
MVSSMFSFRPAANDFSVPIALKPHFWRTGSEPTLSLAARAYTVMSGELLTL